MNLVQWGIRLFWTGATLVLVITIVGLVLGVLPWTVAMVVLGIQLIVAGVAVMIYRELQ